MLSLKFKTTNPTTEEILNEYEVMSYENIDKSIIKAKNAFNTWKENFKKREYYLHSFATEFRKNKENLG